MAEVERIRCSRCRMGMRVGGATVKADRWRCPDCSVVILSGSVDSNSGPVRVYVDPADVRRVPGHRATEAA